MKLPEVDVLAIFDPHIEKVEEFFRSAHVSKPPYVTNDWQDFLSRHELDIISICSPDHEHARHAIDCLGRGFHVLVEKPISTNAADAVRMIEAAQMAGRKLMVHHQMRYLPVFRAAKELTARGELGRVFAAEGDYYHDMRQRAVAYDNWRVQPATYQNIVFGGACHPLDLMQWVADARIEEVFAYANHQAFTAYPDVDTVMALLKFSTGMIGRMTMTIGCNRPSEHTLVLHGDGGTVVNGLLLRTERQGGDSFLWRHIPALAQRVLLRLNREFRLQASHQAVMTHHPTEGLNGVQRLLGRLVVSVGNVLRYPYTMNEHGRACEDLINDFIECVRNDTPLPIDPMESLDAIRVCEAVIASYKTGVPVTVTR
jgi:predicted dehydrogenase